MKAILSALALSFSIVGVCTAQTTPPDFTAPGVIASSSGTVPARPWTPQVRAPEIVINPSDFPVSINPFTNSLGF